MALGENAIFFTPEKEKINEPKMNDFANIFSSEREPGNQKIRSKILF